MHPKHRMPQGCRCPALPLADAGPPPPGPAIQRTEISEVKGQRQGPWLRRALMEGVGWDVEGSQGLTKEAEPQRLRPVGRPVLGGWGSRRQPQVEFLAAFSPQHPSHPQRPPRPRGRPFCGGLQRCPRRLACTSAPNCKRAPSPGAAVPPGEPAFLVGGTPVERAGAGSQDRVGTES